MSILGMCQVLRASVRGAVALLLSAAALQAHATCASLTTLTGGGSVSATFNFPSELTSTSGSIPLTQQSVEGTGCDSSNALRATPSNGSTEGAGVATRAGGGTLNYRLLRSTTVTDYWGDQSNNRITGGIGTDFTVPFYLNDNLNTGFPLAGMYTDSVIVGLFQGNTSVQSFLMAVNVNVPHQCVLSSIPALSLVYTSFAPTVTNVTSFTVQCNTDYTITLDSPTTGTLLGLNYSLSLSPNDSQGALTTGRTHSITGTIVGPQSGNCSVPTGCTATNTHQLTVTY